MKLPAIPFPSVSFPRSPRPLSDLISALPAWPLIMPTSHAFTVAANLAAWPSLRELDWSHIYTRRFCVQLRDIGLKLHFSLHAAGFRAEPNGLADVTFSATTADFARLALRLEDPDTLFFNRRLRIEGDTDLGLTVKNMLDAVELETAAAGMPLGLGRIVLQLRRLAMQA